MGVGGVGSIPAQPPTYIWAWAELGKLSTLFVSKGRLKKCKTLDIVQKFLVPPSPQKFFILNLISKPIIKFISKYSRVSSLEKKVE